MDREASAGQGRACRRKKTKFSRNPKFSIVIPLYKTPEKYLQQLVDSIEAQTYGNWELCLSDGSGADSPLTDYLNRLEKVMTGSV